MALLARAMEAMLALSWVCKMVDYLECMLLAIRKD